MRNRLAPAALLLVLLAAPAAFVAAQPRSPLDKAFDAYWSAGSPKDAAKAAAQVLAAGTDFGTLWQRLRQGRPYAKEKSGRIILRAPAVGGTFENTVEIPDGYDPAVKLPLRVQLHGGVNRPEPGEQTGRGRTVGNRIPGERQIVIEPSGWAEAPWWAGLQVENIMRVVDVVARRFNVDESQVYLTGISDGGTGAFYIGTREATKWSALLPLNGSIIVLRNPATNAEGEVFANNLVNTPMYVVNGGRDPLYPVRDVSSHIAWLQALGVPLLFRPQPEAGHDTSWWPTERAPYEQFVHEHPRQANPPAVSWETERTDRFNREKWLVIDKLGTTSSDTPMPSVGVFLHKRPSGRVDVERHGNDFVATTQGVKAFRLLLSPDVVDLAKPVSVTVNRRKVFEATVAADPAVLLAWHARDNDRTMLYGAEVAVVVP